MTTAAGSQWPGGITRVMLLGEQAVSKAAGWGSNPHARADCRRGSTEKGIRLVSGSMLVRIQSSALAYQEVPMVQRIELDSPKVQALVRVQVWILNECPASVV